MRKLAGLVVLLAGVAFAYEPMSVYTHNPAVVFPPGTHGEESGLCTMAASQFLELPGMMTCISIESPEADAWLEAVLDAFLAAGYSVDSESRLTVDSRAVTLSHPSWEHTITVILSRDPESDYADALIRLRVRVP